MATLSRELIVPLGSRPELTGEARQALLKILSSAQAEFSGESETEPPPELVNDLIGTFAGAGMNCSWSKRIYSGLHPYLATSFANAAVIFDRTEKNKMIWRVSQDAEDVWEKALPQHSLQLDLFAPPNIQDGEGVEALQGAAITIDNIEIDAVAPVSTRQLNEEEAALRESLTELFQVEEIPEIQIPARIGSHQDMVRFQNERSWQQRWALFVPVYVPSEALAKAANDLGILFSVLPTLAKTEARVDEGTCRWRDEEEPQVSGTMDGLRPIAVSDLKTVLRSESTANILHLCGSADAECKNLDRSIRLLNLAMLSNYAEANVVLSIAAIESLCDMGQGDPVAKSVQDCCMLLYRTDQRRAIRKELWKWYKLRSNIVHGGERTKRTAASSSENFASGARCVALAADIVARRMQLAREDPSSAMKGLRDVLNLYLTGDSQEAKRLREVCDRIHIASGIPSPEASCNEP